MAIFNIECERKLSYGRVVCVGEELKLNQTFTPAQGSSDGYDEYWYIGEVVADNTIFLQSGLDGHLHDEMRVDHDTINNHFILKRAVYFVPEEDRSYSWGIEDIIKMAELSLK